MKNKNKNYIDINGEQYNERHLSQLIRRKMMSKVYKDKTKYTRKNKHLEDSEEY